MTYGGDSRRVWARRAASGLLIAGFAVLGTATAGGGDENAASGTHDGIDAMEAHFSSGVPWAEGPEAIEIARTLQSELEPGDSIAVRVIDGTPRRVVALVKYGDAQAEGLADLDDATRQMHLDTLLSDLDALFDTGDAHVGLGIRGTLFYGAVVTRQPGQPAQYQLGAVVSTDAIEAILDAPATAPTPTPMLAVGQTQNGQLRPFPAPPPRYLLTLAAPSRVVPNVVAPSLPEVSTPFAIVCAGAVRLQACADSSLEPVVDEEGNAFYQLAAGTYSVFVLPSEDCEANPGCASANAPYQITMATL